MRALETQDHLPSVTSDSRLASVSLLYSGDDDSTHLTQLQGSLGERARSGDMSHACSSFSLSSDIRSTSQEGSQAVSPTACPPPSALMWREQLNAGPFCSPCSECPSGSSCTDCFVRQHLLRPGTDVCPLCAMGQDTVKG